MQQGISTGTQAETLTKAPHTPYRGPLAIVTTLFFMWGSLTSLNDVLIPYAQHVFNLRLAASMLIQAAFLLQISSIVHATRQWGKARRVGVKAFTSRLSGPRFAISTFCSSQ